MLSGLSDERANIIGAFRFHCPFHQSHRSQIGAIAGSRRLSSVNNCLGCKKISGGYSKSLRLLLVLPLTSFCLSVSVNSTGITEMALRWSSLLAVLNSFFFSWEISAPEEPPVIKSGNGKECTDEIPQ